MTTASSRLSPGGRARACLHSSALAAVTWKGALRPDLPQQIHQPDYQCRHHDKMHEYPPLLDFCDTCDAGNQRLVYGYREISFQAMYFKILDMSYSEL